MQLCRVVVEWAGPPVEGRAVNVLHFAGDAGIPDPADIKTAYQALLGGIPPNVTLTIPNAGDTIEDTTGTLVDVWSSTGGGTITGTAASTGVAAGVGACVGWLTGGIIAGKKLRGRTFIVPIAAGEYEFDGTLNGAEITRLNTFATSLMASGPLAVWHRPTTPGGSDGNSYGVISYKVRDHVAYLSSRRD